MEKNLNQWATEKGQGSKGFLGLNPLLEEKGKTMTVSGHLIDFKVIEFPITTKLVGVTFGKCQRNIRLQGHFYARWRLKREPKNKFDPNAISVRANGFHVGYINRGLAAELAPIIDQEPGRLGVRFVRRNISEKAIKAGEDVIRGLTVKIIEK